VRGGKSKTTENGINAPFIAACPGIVPGGVVSKALIDFTDIGPTFAELAGLPIPPTSAVDGHSFANHLLGRSPDSQRSWILAMGGQNNAQVTDRGVENQYYFRDRVVRDQRYKLFIGPDRKVDKLIDLQTDPEEENDLTGIESPEAMKAKKALESIIESFPDRDNDPLYKPNPSQHWDRKPTKKSMIWKTGYPGEESQNTDEEQP
jgi:arylsulfatase A-like enzyme